MPQQMSDSQEKSDDLIAELAKLMASNAQGGDAEAKPALKMTPLSEAASAPRPAGATPTASPIRIPGMAQPVSPASHSSAQQPAATAQPASSPAAAPTPSSSPTIRIPGMSQPVPAQQGPTPTVAPSVDVPRQEPTAPKPATPAQFDFGRPPGVAPVVSASTPAPQARDEAPAEPIPSISLKSAASEPSAESRPQPQNVAPPVNLDRPVSATPTRVEPALNAPRPAASPSAPGNAPAGDGFDFDFGFGSEPPIRAEPKAEPRAESKHEAGHDPIADLIAAELDEAEAEDEPEASAPRAAAPVPQAPRPAPQSVPKQEASVLVAKPAGTRPALQPQPKPATPASSDRFAVAPVFGLGKPAQPAPEARREPDPMDEIESLIGEAVRVELSPPERPAVQPAPQPQPQPQPSGSAAPVVPPLTTGFAPRRTELKDREPPMQSPEEAILAAAAATGAKVGTIDVEDRRPAKRMKVKPPRSRAASSGSRQFLGMAVAGTLLLAAGLGLYWVLGMGRSDTTNVPVLTADAEPAKQPAPVTTTAETEAPAATGLFDQLQGTAPENPDETLVSRDETAGATPTEVASVASTTTSEDTEGGLANRKVRTVTVRPDGTIVSGDEAVAGNEVLPVDRPTVPELPGGQLEPNDLLAETDTASVDPDAIAAAISGETPVTAEVDPNVSALAPATSPLTVDPTIQAPTPLPRPTNRSAMVGGSEQQASAPASTPLAAAPVTTSSGGNAAAYVQLSSQRSEGDAQASLNRVQSRYGSLLNGNSLEIQRADLGQKGIYYRVRLPAASLQEATSICASIKANGGDCFATGG